MHFSLMISLVMAAPIRNESLENLLLKKLDKDEKVHFKCDIDLGSIEVSLIPFCVTILKTFKIR